MAADWWQALILGIIQGLTEWLPVSSSGHLVVAQELLGYEVPVFFDLWLHLATLAAVVWHYRLRLWGMLTALVGARRDEPTAAGDRRTAWLLVFATLPIVVAGLLFRDAVESAFGSLRAVAVALGVTTLILLSTRWARQRDAVFGMGAALFVGAFQALALAPGVSRSGATIAAGLHAGRSPEDAADFAFLLSIPALVGATVLLAPDAVAAGAALHWSAFVVGAVAAFAVGLATLRFMLAAVRRVGLVPFAAYTAALALVVALLST